MKPRWHFGSPSIPPRAVLLSALALVVPVAASLAGGPEADRYEALLWLTALIPGFLLAYYRGWSGIATGLAAGMAVFSLAQVYLVLTGYRLPDWPFMLGITSALVFLSLLAGGVAQQLHEARERAERLALIDPLTDLPNRRYMELILEKEFAAAQRGRELVVVAFDLDGLKSVNDLHGHAAGDDVIRAFAGVLRSNTRSMNLSARLGGDEFISIVSGTSVEGALVFVERVQHALTELASLPASISVSAGVAEYHVDITDEEHLLNVADEALYEAKRGQRHFAVRRHLSHTGSVEGSNA